MLPNSRVCIYSIDNVMILDKIHKVFLYVRKFDTFKSLYWYFKLKLPRSASFHVYPKSIVDIHENANIEIKRGEFAINSSWFNTRKRRYVSELRVLNGGNMLINDNFSLYQGASIHIGENATLILHGNSFLNTNSTLNCFYRIEIGSGCAISDNVCIHDSDSHVLNGAIDNVCAAVVIKDNVWIGKNVTILKGVTIGEGVVIGAGSVVTKSIPPYCLAVGNPAKVIRENIYWK